MSAEADAICGAPYGMPGRTGSTSATATGTGTSTPGPGRWTWRFPSSGRARISRTGCWNAAAARRARGITLSPANAGGRRAPGPPRADHQSYCSRRSRPLRRPGPSCTRSRTSGPTCHPWSMSFYDTCVAPRYRNGPTGRRRLTGAEAFELEGIDPCYIDIDGFWPRALTVKVRRVCPSPTSITPASKCGGNLAPSPIVAWNRRALCSSLYAGKAVGSPTLQSNKILLG